MRERVDREEQTVWQSGKALEGSGYCHHQDGVERHVIYVRCPYHSPSGEMLGVLTVVTDVSEIKSAEARRAKRRTGSPITDSVPGVVYQYLWLAPGKGRVLYASQGLSRSLLGSASKKCYWRSPVTKCTASSPRRRGAGLYCKVAECAKTLAPIDVEIRSQHPEGER